MYLEKVGVEDWGHWTLELDACEQIKTKHGNEVSGNEHRV